MPFAGGVFTRLYNWVTDRNNSIKIMAARMDAELNGIAAGLSTSVLKDGTQTTTAVVPFAAGISVGTSFVNTGYTILSDLLVQKIPGQANVWADGGASGATDGAQFLVRNAGASIMAIGNKSAITGGGYDATPYLWAGAAIQCNQGAAFGGNVEITSRSPGFRAMSTGPAGDCNLFIDWAGGSPTPGNLYFRKSNGNTVHTVFNGDGSITALGALSVSGGITSTNGALAAYGWGGNPNFGLIFFNQAQTISFQYAAGTWAFAGGTAMDFGGKPFLNTGAIGSTGTITAPNFSATGGRSTFTTGGEPYSLLLKYSTGSTGVYVGEAAAGGLQVSNTGGSSLLTVTPASRVYAATATISEAYNASSSLLLLNGLGIANGGKHFRINAAGALEIVNSDYTRVIFTLGEDGSISSSGAHVINVGSGGHPGAAAIRVGYGTAGCPWGHTFQTATDTANAILFMNSVGTNVGLIQQNVASTVYATTSDGSLKEDLRDFDSGGFFDKVKVYDFAWKAGGRGVGCIAQDLHEIEPRAVTTGSTAVIPATDDEPETQTEIPWGVDYSKLVPHLIAEVQALRNRVAQLEAQA